VDRICPVRASFVTPYIDSGEAGLAVSAKDWGFTVFLMTPVLLMGLIGEGFKTGNVLTVLLVAAAWLNNFSVFLRFPPAAAWVPILIPWSLLIAAALNLIPLGPLWTSVPFYPWALGIGFIHASAYFEPKKIFDRWIAEF